MLLELQSYIHFCTYYKKVENYRGIPEINEFQQLIWMHQDLKYQLMSYKIVLYTNVSVEAYWEAETEMKLRVQEAY